MRSISCSLLSCTLLVAQESGVRQPVPTTRLQLFDVRHLDAPLARRLGGAPVEAPLAKGIDELLRLYLPDGKDASRDTLSLDGGGKTLLARIDATQADWVTRFLARQSGDTCTIRVEASVFRLSEQAATALDLRNAARLFRDPAEATSLVEKLEQKAGKAREKLPPFDTLPLAVSRTSRTTPLSYVRDWRLFENVQPGGKTIVDPVIDIVDEGAVLDARVVLLDGGEIGIEVELTWRRVERPIEVTKREVAGQTLEVAVPRVDEVRVSSALVAPADSVAVLTLPESTRQASVLVLRIGAPVQARKR